MKAIIPAAGHGTRFLPITRVVPKEMLPIGSKPALEWIVDEAKSAGASEIVMVISPGKELIREYFKQDPAINFVYQTEQHGLGHAVFQAKDALQGESSALILLGDALVAGCNAAKEMAEFSRCHGNSSVIGLERVSMEKVSRYGIVKIGDDDRIVDMVEKPSPEAAPSNLAIAGRYLLNTKIFDCLATQTPGKGGEIQLTDAIRRMLGDVPTCGYVYPGKRQDIGNPHGYFRAMEAMHAND